MGKLRKKSCLISKVLSPHPVQGSLPPEEVDADVVCMKISTVAVQTQDLWDGTDQTPAF
jgi:hypothetical protein